MSYPQLTATAVWRTSDDLVLALDERFGEPLDAYVNGSQVWLRDDGPNGMTLEWRLHPVGSYERPPNVPTTEIFTSVVFSLRNGEAPVVTADRLWGGLEAFAAYGEEVEPANLRAAVTESLGVPPDAAGLVDHRSVGDEWERSAGATSIIDSLLRQLEPAP